ncbi:hypothetical protein PSECIP111951_04147 [Pseudoalteromonas holothuriae]|uniref:Uncharacterized protein n=2 Tax=Pseudoalteromonas holothuriae TaxID=2963714 RepID=A0ABM9GPY1_9GAMM|nr:hypothetical protein PSECIP111951_04147 [Pseudoalteromonas sp. CIP111951]
MAILWDLLVQSGLITIPLIALFFANAKALLELGYSDELFNSVVSDLLLIIAVWAVAVLPWATFQYQI